MIDIEKQKMKFLEDYFSLCLEHGFCVDFTGEDLVVADWPSHICPEGWFNYWEESKKELRGSISNV